MYLELLSISAVVEHSYHVEIGEIDVDSDIFLIVFTFNLSFPGLV